MNNIYEVYFIAHDSNFSSSKIKYNDNYLFLQSKKVGKKMPLELWIPFDNKVLKNYKRNRLLSFGTMK